MDNDKSILEKIGDAVKDLAKVATDAANDVMKVDAPALKADERALAYMPLAAEGLVSDPLMMPPVAVSAGPQEEADGKEGEEQDSEQGGREIRPKDGEEIRKQEASEGWREAGQQAGRQEDS